MTDREKIEWLAEKLGCDVKRTATSMYFGHRRYHFDEAGEVARIFDYQTQESSGGDDGQAVS